MGNTTPGLSGPGINGNGGVLLIIQTPELDSLVWFRGLFNAKAILAEEQ